MSSRKTILKARLISRRLMLAGLVTLATTQGRASAAEGRLSSAESSASRWQDAAQVESAGMLESSAPSGSHVRLITGPSLASFLQSDSPLPSGNPSASGDPSASGAAEVREQVEGDRLGTQSIFGGDAARSPSIVRGRFDLPPLMAATTEMSEIGTGRMPAGFRDGGSPVSQSLPESGFARSAEWDASLRTWAAPNTFSHPRYFEDRMLERHGHQRFPHLQPLVSGTRFFATAAMLPYLMTVRHPCDCEYTLGYYRTGSCVPLLKQRPPYERRAAVVQGLSVATAIIALP